MSKGAKALQVAQDQKWEAEEDVRTLNRAVEIFNNSARFKRAQSLMTEQEKTAKEVKAFAQMLQKKGKG